MTAHHAVEPAGRNQETRRDAMKKNDVQIGATYLVRVTGKLAPVRIVCEHPHHGWNGVNVDTKREVRIKSAQRLRKRLDAAPRALPSDR